MADSKDKSKFKFGFKPQVKLKVGEESQPKSSKSGKEPLPARSSDQTVEEKLAQLQAEIDSQATASQSSSASSSKFSTTSSALSKPDSKSAGNGKTGMGKGSGNGSSSTSQPTRTHMALFWGMVLFSVILSAIPYANILFTPINQFTTLIHEMGHAFAAILTGGHVNNLTMVSDGQGHGGLTFSSGGISFIITQAGYLGTAIAGCGLVWLSQFRKWSRHILVGIGLVIGFVTVFMMVPGLFSMQAVQAFFSILWGVALAAATIWAGLKLKDSTANLIILFLAIQTATDSLKSIVYVIQATVMGATVTSDASFMQQQFFLPAIFWSVSWVLISIALLAITIYYTYGAGIFQGKVPKATHSGTAGKGTKFLPGKKTKGK